MAIVTNGSGIDMGGNPVSNASQIDSVVINENGLGVATTSDVNTAAVVLKTIATGTATFTATTNNINLTGIGIGVEIGDVIQISGAEDAKNNSEFTVEVITDANNIIVNQAHANKDTTKNVATRASDTGVTVKLLAKWYNAKIGLGQDWVDVTGSRILSTAYQNKTRREIHVSVRGTYGVNIGGTLLYIGTEAIASTNVGSAAGGRFTVTGIVTFGNSYYATCVNTLEKWYELR